MRKFLLQLHLWVGLTAGAVLAFMGLMGSLYVFQPELTVALYPEHYKSSEPEAAPVEVRLVVKNAEEQFGGQVTNIFFPVRELENYIVKVKGNKQFLFFDAATGNYVGQLEKRRGAMDTVLDLHRHLAMGDTGALITRTCALLLAFVLLSTGLYLWFPRKRHQLKERLRLKPNASFKRRNFDLHNVFGFYFSIPLFLAAITGVYFGFQEQTQNVVDKLTLAKEPTPYVKALRSSYQEATAPLTVYEALDRMDALHPGYVKRTLVMAPDSAATLNLTYLASSELEAGPQYRPMVYLDQYTGAIVYDYNPHTAPVGTQLTRNWFVPTHFGEIGGWITRILWFFLGLVPATLWVTGIVMWRGKSKKKKKGYVKTRRGVMARKI
ncbi:PepSY-associated TM helix domain-containing protein [Pontibacter sp. BT731]|uniref:PepSY-associated TM helix domain-containing protein n=1 Tax=Pontibacter coccineus TaxID=3063328 RepID=UPI0026E12A1E|nr:PepSY-associated TM helix domain-containing protein [Pontibacter sp. BT731]MDO6389104.1 PepSY-associated TM helix domain-containing protein [Pontibacter sp. BT731]